MSRFRGGEVGGWKIVSLCVARCLNSCDFLECRSRCSRCPAVIVITHQSAEWCVVSARPARAALRVGLVIMCGAGAPRSAPGGSTSTIDLRPRSQGCLDFDNHAFLKHAAYLPPTAHACAVGLPQQIVGICRYPVPSPAWRGRGLVATRRVHTWISPAGCATAIRGATCARASSHPDGSARPRRGRITCRASRCRGP